MSQLLSIPSGQKTVLRASAPVRALVSAAALFGIGIESYLGRNAGVEAFTGMLNLKIIWSLSAVVGIALSLLQDALL